VFHGIRNEFLPFVAGISREVNHRGPAAAGKLRSDPPMDGFAVAKDSTITHADSLLSAFSGKLPYKIRTNSTNGKMMVSDANTLSNYNNGLLTPVCTP
jgi:hypothetical protein